VLLKFLRRALGGTPPLPEANAGQALAPEARYALAQGLQKQKRLSEAVEHYRALLATHPEQAVVHNHLANCLSLLGRAAEAVSHYRRYCELQPSSSGAVASLLGALNYDPDVGPGQVFEEHRVWAARIAASSGTPMRHAIDGDVTRRLRIGYVSPDLKRHPVTYLFAPALAHHDHGGFEIVCYDNLARPDHVTARLARLTDRWRDVTGLTDEAFCEQVRADGIDILVDLAGHTTGGRLSAFARKPAPVQVSWLGYFNTTGFPAMDWFFSDPHSSPPGQERYFVERLLRLPDTRFCYAPPEYSPEVAAPPAAREGRVTFGCFNNLSKINDRVIALWSRVLDRVPGSRLRLMSIGLHDAANVEHVRGRFAKHGVQGERLELYPYVAHPELLAAYGEVDIALDPFPFCGGMTSLEALWMGVPVVTLEQPMIAGRQTLSMLRNVGLETLVAADEQGYVEIAAKLAGDLDALARVRAELRPSMAASPLMDGAKFTRNLEDAYRRVWLEAINAEQSA